MSRTPKAPVTPALLSWAREIAGYAPSEAAQRVPVPEERLSAWELGEEQPTLAQLRKLARLYRRAPAFFFLDEPPPSDLPEAPDFRGRTERGHLSPRLRREMRLAAERREAFLELHGPPGRNPAIPEVDTEAVEPAAREVRKAIGVTVGDQLESRSSQEALTRWLDAVESAGVLVFQMSRVPLSEARGFSIYEPVAPVIALNGADLSQARCFTLFHELCHLLERSGGVCGWTDVDAERRSNAFAAEVLMPREDFVRELGANDPAEMVGILARRFRVSHEAAAIRLRVLGRLSQDDVERVREETARRVAELKQQQREREGGPPHHRTHLRNLGPRYVEAVLDAYYDDRITITDAAHYLDAKVATIERMEDALRERAAG